MIFTWRIETSCNKIPAFQNPISSIKICPERKRFSSAKFIIGLLFLSLFLFPALSFAQPIVIDDFSVDHPEIETSGATPVVFSAVQDASILGQQRDMEVYLLNGSDTSGKVSNDFFTFNTASLSEGGAFLIYDGVDADPSSSGVAYTGLGGVDLTNGGTQCALELGVVEAESDDGVVIFRVYTDSDNYSATPPITIYEYDQYASSGLDIYVIPFGSFVPAGGSGPADFSNVGAIVMEIDGDSAYDCTLGLLQTRSILTYTKSDTLSLDKNSNNKANPGDEITYTITIDNPDDDSDIAATGVVFRDTPDENTTIVEISSFSQGATPEIVDNGSDPPYVDWTVGTINDGASATITFVVRVNDPLPVSVTQIVNQGRIFSDTCGCSLSSSNCWSLTDNTVPPPQGPDTSTDPNITEAGASPPHFSPTKTDHLDTGESVSPGDEVTYTVVITNDGLNRAENVVFTDPFDTNCSLVPNSVTTIPDATTAGYNITISDTQIEVEIGEMVSGDTVTIEFVVEVNNPLPAGTDEIVNRGELSADSSTGSINKYTDDDPSEDGEQPTITPVTAAPDISVTKTDNTSGPVSPGEQFTYTLTIVNDGDIAETNVTLADPIGQHLSLAGNPVRTTPPGLTVNSGNSATDTSVSVSAGTIAGGGGTVVVEFDVVVDNPLPAGVTEVSNQATVDGDSITPVVSDDPTISPGTDDPTVTDIDASPKISVTKTDGTSGPVSPGEQFTYIVTIVNDGDIAETNVTLADPIGQHLSLAGNPVRTTPPGLTVNSGNSATDTSVSVSAGTIAGGGGTVVVEFDVVVDNPLPAGVTEVSNQATVDGDSITPVVSDDPGVTPGTDDPTVTDIDASPQISVTKTDDTSGPVSPGEQFTYIVTIVNDGDIAETNVTLADPIGQHLSLAGNPVRTTPPGLTVNSGNNATDTSVSVSAGTIAGGGGTVVVEFDVVVDNPLPAGVTEVSNQATVDGDSITPLVSDDPGVTPGTDDPTVTDIDASPKISVTKTDDTSGPVSPGEQFTYIVTIVNDGDIAETNVTLADPIGQHLSLAGNPVRTTPPGLTVNSGNNATDTSVSVSAGTIAGGGGTVVVEFDVVVDNPLPAGVTEVSNQATVDGDSITPLVSDDPGVTPGTDDPTVTDVDAAPEISVEKSDAILADNDGVVDPGGTIRYSIVIENNGDMDAAGVIFTDPPVDNATLVAGSVTPEGMVSIGNGPNDTSVRVDVGTLAGNGGTVTIEFEVIVDNPIPEGVDQISNQGTARGDNFDPVDSDDPSIGGMNDPTITQLTAAPVVTATKVDALFDDADGDNFFGPGDTVRYTIVITNSGNTEATGVVLQDPAVANAALVVGFVTPSQGTVVHGNNSGDTAVEVNVGNIPANGGTATVTFDVVIADPLPDGITRISNQATISGTNLSESVVTDDPSTPAQNDPTVTPILPVSAEKTAVLQIDNNNNGVANPGDTIRYTIAIVNNGPQDSTDTVFTDSEDDMVNSALVSGFVVTSQGKVTSGNTDGDASVVVALGTLPANGGEATVTFDVVIDNPFPLDADSIDNQGRVRYVFNNQTMQVLTDEPGTAEPEDETIVVVEPEPVIPTLSEIGTLLMALLLTAATLLVARRKKA